MSNSSNVQMHIFHVYIQFCKMKEFGANTLRVKYNINIFACKLFHWKCYELSRKEARSVTLLWFFILSITHIFMNISPLDKRYFQFDKVVYIFSPKAVGEQSLKTNTIHCLCTSSYFRNNLRFWQKRILINFIWLLNSYRIRLKCAI